MTNESDQKYIAILKDSYLKSIPGQSELDFDIEMDTPIYSLLMDSRVLLEFLFNVEKKLDLRIEPNMLAEFEKVGQFVEWLKGKCNK